MNNCPKISLIGLWLNLNFSLLGLMFELGQACELYVYAFENICPNGGYLVLIGERSRLVIFLKRRKMYCKKCSSVMPFFKW